MSTLRKVLFLLIPVMLIVSSCSYSRVHTLSFHQAETCLVSRLQMTEQRWAAYRQAIEKGFIPPPNFEYFERLPSTHRLILGGAHPDKRLLRYMPFEDYSTEVKAYEEGRHLQFTAYDDYNIFGSGGQYIHFNLRKVDDSRTRVSVDFSDRSLILFIIPTWNPGIFRERRIADEIFGGHKLNNTR